MIQKVKELLAISEEIGVIKNNIKYTTNAVSEMKEELHSFKDALREQEDAYANRANEHAGAIAKSVADMQLIRKEFENELFQFKLLKSQMQKKVMEQFEEELSKEMQLQMVTLKNDSTAYNELKEQLLELTKKINSASGEIDKFTNIARNIRKEDFELHRFGRQLLDMDKEKLDLMRKIDTLERLISRMRRHEVVER